MPVLPKQHAPVLEGGVGLHVVLVHWVFGPWNAPPKAAHCVAVACTHWLPPAGAVTQQAPVCPGPQGLLGLQVDPTPWNVPLCAAHWAWVVM
jgi:hypothetical protein